MTVELWCGHCGQSYPAEQEICYIHQVDLRPAAATAAQDPDRSPAPRPVCWNCGEKSPNARNDHCNRCRQSLIPPPLAITFRTGLLVLTREETVDLGRCGPYAHLFQVSRYVSRRHAVLWVDDAGEAWIRPAHQARNGTFVNDEEITGQTKLASADRVRLASAANGVTGEVTRPEFD